MLSIKSNIIQNNSPQMAHGSPTSSTRHVGDLGNIVSSTSTGITTISITDSIISLRDGNAAKILGRSFVIHQNVDQFTQPTGNAGTKISCGIIETCDSTCQQTFNIWNIDSKNTSCAIIKLRVEYIEDFLKHFKTSLSNKITRQKSFYLCD